jgi:uncharacterized protein
MTKLFFATDLHGSEVCFRKFVAAASFYGADLLILGGDLTGKLVVPVVEQADGRFWTEMHGEQRHLAPADVDAFEREAADQGLYATTMSAAEYAVYADDPEAVDGLFETLMLERLTAWIDYAHERLDGTEVRIITAPGNDDPFSIDDVIRSRGGDRVLLTEGEVVELAPGHEMLNTGWSNHTPWNTHREFDEDELAAHIEEMAVRLERPDTAVFNIHVPPFDSSLDTAPQLDSELRVQSTLGTQLMAAVGSTAVRAAIERWQPLVSLHGHIHEAGGAVRIGRTVAINAGSEYGEGILRGVLVTIGGGRLHGYQATSG